ncbi:MAG: hypothetical protein C4297_06150 [Gemmataceae bacterium]
MYRKLMAPAALLVALALVASAQAQTYRTGNYRQASREKTIQYLESFVKIAKDLQKSITPTTSLRQDAQTLRRTAARIAALPKAGVDPELLEWSADFTGWLRRVANWLERYDSLPSTEAAVGGFLLALLLDYALETEGRITLGYTLGGASHYADVMREGEALAREGENLKIRAEVLLEKLDARYNIRSSDAKPTGIKA